MFGGTHAVFDGGPQCVITMTSRMGRPRNPTVAVKGGGSPPPSASYLFVI